MISQQPNKSNILGPGTKVVVTGSEKNGFGELVAFCAEEDRVEVKYFTSPLKGRSVRVPASSVFRAVLPAQTRAFQQFNGYTRYGRVLLLKEKSAGLGIYLVQFAGEVLPVALAETEFSVRSYLPGEDPLDALAALANETPFFFEARVALLRELQRQNQLSHGLPSLLSSKIDLLPHQIQIAELVLRDPKIRYLLADEVGLGKTIEAGIILRQLQIDAPGVKIAAFVPDVLMQQWREELDNRFDLVDVRLFGHGELEAQAKLKTAWDLVVIDEAHRVIVGDDPKVKALWIAAGQIARSCRHLLLLSATPLLHHDAELLALLELLDPENYSSGDLAAFRDRTERRVLLGRAFLALRNAAALPLIKLNAKKLAELLPDDTVVQQMVGELMAGRETKTVHRALHLHISETYRIHRRLLRTRRSWIAANDRQFVRAVDERAETEVDEEMHLQLWETLEEWRTEAAARVGGAEKETRLCAAQYIRLAEAIAAEPECLAELVEEVMESTKASEVERGLLDDLVEPRSADKMMRARAELVCEILQKRFSADGTSAKYVVFCSSAETCRTVGKALKRHISQSAIRMVDRNTESEEAGAIFLEFAADDGRVLVTDATGEEGFNLQFVRAVIFHDLPWSPMRIEQRLGRLDRIERAGKIVCFDITSGEDETLCMDEVWRQVLAEGFGIFRHSISDLQHVIEQEIPRLQERAFLGGPEALAAEIEALKARIAGEREAIEEQDVIDGMHSLLADSALCRDLAEADKMAGVFGDALVGYLSKNVGLHPQTSDGDNSVSFVVPRNAEAILPQDRLDLLAELIGCPTTFFRNVAAETFDLQFLRPGHAAVDACHDLLAWDDRGRVFAMWRKAGGLKHVKFVFRCIVHVRADLGPVMAKLKEAKWEALRRGGLLRMVRGWFPDFLGELFLDENGDEASDALAKCCREPYGATDVNLGKEKAAYIRQEYGEETWRKWCKGAAEAALRTVALSGKLQSKQTSALTEATEHFALARTRLAARERAGIEPSDSTRRARQVEDQLEELVMTMLGAPVIRLDTIGAYLLSEKPFWKVVA